MLLSDDSVPHTGRNRQNYSLYTAEDKARFVTLQNAQAHIINKLKQWIDSEYPEPGWSTARPGIQMNILIAVTAKPKIIFTI